MISTALGKRRMLLGCETGELELKVPKELRGQLFGLAVGTQISVGGREECDHFGRLVRRVASSFRLPFRVHPATACDTCPIRVCTKKSCWKNGGKELFAALEQTVADSCLQGRFAVKGVHCLGNCKHGPNVTVGQKRYQHCAPGDAQVIVAEAAG